MLFLEVSFSSTTYQWLSETCRQIANFLNLRKVMYQIYHQKWNLRVHSHNSLKHKQEGNKWYIKKNLFCTCHGTENNTNSSTMTSIKNIKKLVAGLFSWFFIYNWSLSSLKAVWVSFLSKLLLKGCELQKREYSCSISSMPKK